MSDHDHHDEAPTFHQRLMPGARFEQVDLTGARLHQVLLVDATIHGADASGLEVREVYFGRTRWRGVMFHDSAIEGVVEGLTINGVDVGPLIEAELDRLHPERPRLRPTTADGFRDAWDLVEELWAGTVEKARRLGERDPALLHERVDGEWSFVDTQRHLAFVTESWLLRVIGGDPAPWGPLTLPPEDGHDTDAVPCDRSARPSLDEALTYRHDRMAAVRRFVDGLTDERLAERTVPVDAPGGPPARDHPIGEALQVILDEEWWHRRFALRDLAVLEARVTDA